MKRSQFPFAWFLPILGLLFFVKCSKIEVEPSKDSADSSGLTLQALRILLDSTGKGGFPLDSLLQKYPNFSIRFDPISVGKFTVEMATKRVVFEKNRNDWTIDSTRYEICIEDVCKKSWVVVRNYKPENDGCVALPTIGPISVPLLGQTIETLWPRKTWGKITSITPGFYSVNVIETDSNKIRFRAVGNPNYYGFDEVDYTIKDSLGKCYTGKIIFSIGDPCEASAYNDSLILNGTQGQWPVSTFLANDTACGGPVPDLVFRISPFVNYTGSLTVQGAVGFQTDTTINGSPYFKYRKHKMAATKDEFWYYVFDPGTSKITRAKIKINFQ